MESTEKKNDGKEEAGAVAHPGPPSSAPVVTEEQKSVDVSGQKPEDEADSSHSCPSVCDRDDGSFHSAVDSDSSSPSDPPSKDVPLAAEPVTPPSVQAVPDAAATPPGPEKIVDRSVSTDSSASKEEEKKGLESAGGSSSAEYDDTEEDDRFPPPERARVSPSENATLFDRVSYLGVSSINAPRSKVEIMRTMMVLNQEKSADGEAVDVSIRIPHMCTGTVVIYDAESQAEIRQFPIQKILFCANGALNSAQAACFAFTCIHGDDKDKDAAVFQCHVLRCHILEAVPMVMRCFEMAFRRGSRPSTGDDADGGVASRSSVPPGPVNVVDTHVFEVALEIREEDSKGNFSAVPKDKSYFKLRCDTDKRVCMTVHEVAADPGGDGFRRELTIERCFGLLISPGKHVRDGDMQLLEMICNTEHNGNGRQQLAITGHWDCSDSALELLNVVTQPSSNVFMSVAVDLVMCGIQQPVRFTIETAAKIFQKTERFWYIPRKHLVQQFALKIKLTDPSSSGEPRYEVLDLTSLGELDRSRQRLHLNLNTLSNFASSALAAATSGRNSLPDTPNGLDEDSDWDDEDDEPLMSGAGEVSKECSMDELKNWAEVLATWKAQKHDFLPPLVAVVPSAGSFPMSRRVRRNKIPRQLLAYVKDGIPEALRGEVWQLLAGCDLDPKMLDNYRLLIAQSCTQEQAIERDINRTFPGHEFFQDRRGPNDKGINGQEALFKVCKAVSVYDKELGYCQGLSFLAAALLLHMPEEQAFALLVKILYDYGLRDLFIDDFNLLHVRFYQLDRLILEHLPDLAYHLKEQGVESHMFASQWFLTLFTAKFPLYLVFHILDLFLLCGLDTTFQIALALLSVAKRELLSADFEGILRYFRIGLPRRYHKSEDYGKHLIHLAGTFKLRKLEKYERQYHAITEAAKQEDPVVALKRENHRLMEDNMRLEREIDALLMEKIQLRSDLDQADEEVETLVKELKTAREHLLDVEDDKTRIEVEATQVKEMFKKEMLKWEHDNERNLRIIAQYKAICSQLSQRLDTEGNGGSPSSPGKHDNGSQQSSGEASIDSGFKTCEAGAAGDDGENGPESFYQKQVRELELSLAQTKLDLVEAQCKNQDLTHQVATLTAELHGTPRRDSWLTKTLSSLKEAARDIADKEDKG